MDLIGFRLHVEKGAQVEVSVYFSEQLPEDAGWFKYDIQNGWQDFSQHAVFTNTENGQTIVTFQLKDGGVGDEDGVENGVIVDPSGPGFSAFRDTSSATAGNSNITNADSEAASGCFISIGKDNHTAMFSNKMSIFLLLFSLAGLVSVKKSIVRQKSD